VRQGPASCAGLAAGLVLAANSPSNLELASSPANNEFWPGPRAASPHREVFGPAAAAKRRAPARANHRPGSPSASSPVGLTLPNRFGGSQPARPARAAAYRRALDASLGTLATGITR
jgi:hypothetical protein